MKPKITKGKPFLVSVITPVYNAAQFVTRSVESALAQPETAEVLLIEDGSPDGSLVVCQALAEKYEKVKLLRHPNGENRGPGASRNLGLKQASHDYIAFVDADNFYLPNRFATVKDIFRNIPDCEGVYEIIGNFVQDEAGLQRWLNANRDPVKLTGLTKPVEPGDLASVLINGGCGGLTLDGLTLRRSVLKKSGFMAEELRLHQDTDFIIRAALVAKLYPGNLQEPVALRGIHDHNRLSAPRSQMREYKNRMAYWMCLYRWSKKHANSTVQKEILRAIVRYSKAHKYFKKFPLNLFPVRLVWLTRLIRLVAYPEVIYDLLKR